MFEKLKLPTPLRDALIIALCYFAWSLQSRLASMENTLSLVVSGKINTAQYGK